VTNPLTHLHILADRDKIKKLATDPMFKLEHESTDKTKIRKALPGLGEIEAIQTAKKDDYILNKMARQMFRVSSCLTLGYFKLSFTEFHTDAK
jgi:hypothetical protein